MHCTRHSVIFAVFAVFMLPSIVQAEAEALYAQTCAVCHGKNAQGNEALHAPGLAGQQAAYLNRQLVNFRDGLRGNTAGDTYGQQMAAMSAQLSDAQIQSLSQWLAEQEPLAVSDTAGDVKRGEKYYQSYCGSCHGVGGRGNEALNSPNLQVMRPAYQLRQYQNFLHGERGTHKDDKYGRQMALIASNLQDEAIIQDIFAYISLQSSP